MPLVADHTKGDMVIASRRETRRSLGAAPISATIVERHYQTRAIRRIAEAFERDHDRKALLVMATGAGKTRTVIALCDLRQSISGSSTRIPLTRCLST